MNRAGRRCAALGLALVSGCAGLSGDPVQVVDHPPIPGEPASAPAAAPAPAGVTVSTEVPSPPPPPAPPVEPPPFELLRHKPTGDPRLYQYSRFANGLQVVNIYDPGSTQAAFAVSVQSGSFYDYNATEDAVKYLGLAHLTEHALFLGTEKFPDRSGFDRFLADHGGSSNAYTDTETTVFFGDCSAGAFEAGLERFADFFAAPLLDPEGIWKEVNAVDSEHSKNRHNPSWEMSRIMLSLASPQSPLQWFHTGDKETLEHGGKEDLAAAIRHYFNKNFCPPRMRVVTFSPDPLHLQLANVTAFFSNIPRQGVAGVCEPEPRSFKVPQPFDKTHIGQFLHVQGGSPQLWMLFPLDSLKPWHKSHPILYIKYLLGYEGPHSLQMTLRDKLEIAYGVSMWSEDSSAGTQVWLVSELTPKGAAAPQTVLDTIFSYLERARRTGVDREILESLAKASYLDWEWASLQRPMDAASHIAEEMTRLGPDELLSADSLIDEPNTDRILEVLHQLRPNNTNVCFIDPDADDNWDPNLDVLKLPYYGTRYTVESLLERFPRMHEWAKWPADASEDVQLALTSVDRALGARLQKNIDATPDALPMEVPGAILDLPDKLSMQYAEAAYGFTELGRQWGESPRKLNTTSGNLFYRQGWMLPRPRVFAAFNLRRRSSGVEAGTPVLHGIQLELGMRILTEQMSEALESLSRAGAGWRLVLWSGGLGLSVSGYESIVSKIATRVLHEFKRGLDTTNKKRCDRIVKQFMLELQDNTAQPLKQAGQDLSILLSPNSHAKAELRHVLKPQDVTCEAAKQALERGRVGSFADTSLVMGSCSSADATQLHNQVIEQLGMDVSLAAADVDHIQRVVRPARPVELRAHNPQWGDQNHVLLMQVLIGVATVEQKVLLGLVGSLLSQIIFAELRTKQQLGYIVGGDVSQRSNVLTASCYVQGEVLEPDEVEAQCEKVFAVHVPAAIENLTDSAFESQKSAFRNSILQKPMSTAEEASHFEGQMLLGSCFTFAESMLQFLEQVTSKRQLLDAWNEAMLPSSGLRSKVAVKYWGKGSRIPPPPSTHKWERLLQEAGLSDADIDRGVRERNETLAVAEANSSTRAALVAEGGYYSGDVICTLRTHPEPEVNTTVNTMEVISPPVPENAEVTSTLPTELSGIDTQTTVVATTTAATTTTAADSDDPDALLGSFVEEVDFRVGHAAASRAPHVEPPRPPVREPRGPAALVRRDRRQAASMLALMPDDVESFEGGAGALA